MAEARKILYVASTASHLKRFHKPYLDALSKRAAVFTMANGDGVSYPMPFEKRFFSLANIGCVFKIRRILRREKFDLLVLNTSLAAFWARLALVGLRKRPYVLNIVHGYLFSKHPRTFRERLLLLCERVLRGVTDEIATMNDADFWIAQRYHLCRGQVTKISGMGFSIEEKIPKKQALRAEFTRSERDLLCVYVGELSERKNQRFLIECVWRLRFDWIPIRLLLVGDGEMRAALEREIEELDLADAVTLIGNAEPPTPYFAAADLYLSASRSEGLPFNIMEAMAMGLPIVATNVKGQSDLLRGTSAKLIRAGDWEAFCNAVKSFYDNQTLGVGAVSYPNIPKYQLSAVFAENLALLERCLEEEGRM